MQVAEKSPFWSRAIVIGLAFCQGGLIYALIEKGMLSQFGQVNQVAVGLFVTVTLAVFMLLHRREQKFSDGLFSIIVGLMAALLYKGSIEYLGFAGPKNLLGPFEFLLALAAIYAVPSIIPAPIYQAIRARGKNGFSLTPIFRHAGANLVALITALVVVGLSWLLLAIWGVSFMASGEKYFVELFQKPKWIWPFTATILAVSVAIARQWLTQTHFSFIVRLFGGLVFVAFLGLILFGGILILGVEAA